MKITEFIQDFKDKKIMNTKINPDAVSKYIKETLQVKKYIPFRDKRIIAEEIINKNTKKIDGIKINDSINQYMSFVVAMIAAHTNLEFSEDPVVDYDLLAESGLLSQIIAEFQESYNECDIILKMALASELESNNINFLVGNFLNHILKILDGVSDKINRIIEDVDVKEFLEDFKGEDLAKLNSFLDRYNK